MFIKPELASTWDARNSPAGYVASEKLDGVRAMWDGTKLYTRNGNEIFAPDWFKDGIPSGIHLDGELYSGRCNFEKTSGTVRKILPVDSEWRDIKYIVFDSPCAKGVFLDRIQEMKEALEHYYVVEKAICGLIEFFYPYNQEELIDELEKITSKGGEGIMLRYRFSKYIPGKRSDSLFKVKPAFDDEAIVVGHTEGNGRNAGRLGALKCRRIDEHIHFKCSGMDDWTRLNPPKIGSIITYKHSGFTKYGKPRHPRFLRVRNENAEM